MGDTLGSEANQAPTLVAEPVSAVPLPVAQREEETEGVDVEISGAIATGDPRRALSLCVQEHGAAVGRLCLALVGDPAEADELTQETLFAIYCGFADWKGEGSVRGWIFGVARRKCLQHLEKNRRRVGKLRLVDERDPVGPEDLAALRQRAETIRGALDAIRPTEREALLLRYVAQLSFSDVATACGIEEGEARTRVSRAILKLRGQMETEA